MKKINTLKLGVIFNNKILFIEDYQEGNNQKKILEKNIDVIFKTNNGYENFLKKYDVTYINILENNDVIISTFNLNNIKYIINILINEDILYNNIYINNDFHDFTFSNLTKINYSIMS